MSMTEAEAKKLTEQIRDNINQSARLIQKAHEGRVWVALDIPSFAEWLKKAVGISRARGYQLLDIAKFEDQLREKIDLPEHFILTDRQTRLIKKEGIDRVVEAAHEMTVEDEAVIERRGTSREEANYQSLVEAINEIEDRANETPEPEIGPVEPVEPNVQAKSYFTQFLYQIDDLPGMDLVEPTDFAQIIKDLEASAENIDKLVNDYLGVEQGSE